MAIREMSANVTHSHKFYILENLKQGRKDTVAISLEKAGSRGPAACWG